MRQSNIVRQRKKYPIEREYTPFLIKALNNVDGNYYSVLTTYDEIVRERVFCYEFYHQMRLIGRNYSLGKLHPEIDKSGHEKFKAEDRKNPDFIFHTPGQMKGNQVVIEVKGKINGDIFKDFDTLSIFCQRYHYKVGYFILFGNSFLSLVGFLSKEENVSKIMKYSRLKNITVICKRNERSETEVVRLNNLIDLLTNGRKIQ
ncbi:hypothetical protein [Lederbergia citrea]|uniref:hypothetical protein n=1 Tax=Lederbergia citrea TaxID=2833581 RepID=UPI001BC96B3A|nr:hypothetical protein [Lederbergia citrea]MBS4178779.1 hypothetical protein [Lederbergia citrea]